MSLKSKQIFQRQAAAWRRCGGAHGRKDAEGRVGATHASPIFEGLRVPRVPRPATASDSAAAAEAWRHVPGGCHMRARLSSIPKQPHTPRHGVIRSMVKNKTPVARSRKGPGADNVRHCQALRIRYRRRRTETPPPAESASSGASRRKPPVEPAWSDQPGW